LTRKSDSWPVAPLSALADLSGGFAFKSKDYASKGRFVLRTLNIDGDCGITRRDAVYIPEELCAQYQRFELQPFDTLFVMVGATLGKVGLVREKDLPALLNQNMWLIRAKSDRADPHFLHYSFREAAKTSLGWATGSARDFVRRDDYRNLKVVAPPLPIQRKIAAILSTYDDLIENNNRRIELLEEMAQRTYREWFIDFRYPGRESVPLVQSELGPMPEGWTVRALGEIVHDVRDSIKTGPVTAVRPYVPIDCISAHSLALVACKPGFEAASSLLVFNRGDILFGAMRPYFHKVALAPYTGTTRSTCFVLRVPRASDYSFAVMTLFDEHTIEYATNHSSGTTIPYARWKGSLAAKLLPVPDAHTMNRFDAAIRPFLELLTDAGARLANLRGARDLLLPRLISGEIDVGELDIAVSDLAA
jgi:type I restriction enzyme, S subunit